MNQVPSTTPHDPGVAYAAFDPVLGGLGGRWPARSGVAGQLQPVSPSRRILQPTSVATTAPDRSLLEMNPRAGLSASRRR
jgi:hypothetical protein